MDAAKTGNADTCYALKSVERQMGCRAWEWYDGFTESAKPYKQSCLLKNKAELETTRYTFLLRYEATRRREFVV